MASRSCSFCTVVRLVKLAFLEIRAFEKCFVVGPQHGIHVFALSSFSVALYFRLKKNQNALRPSEHPPVRGGKMSERLGGVKDCKYKTS